MTLEEPSMVVNSSGFVTAGAALAHIDLALWLIRRSSPSVAELAARFLIILRTRTRSCSDFTECHVWSGAGEGAQHLESLGKATHDLTPSR